MTEYKEVTVTSSKTLDTCKEECVGGDEDDDFVEVLVGLEQAIPTTAATDDDEDKNTNDNEGHFMDQLYLSSEMKRFFVVIGGLILVLVVIIVALAIPISKNYRENENEQEQQSTPYYEDDTSASNLKPCVIHPYAQNLEPLECSELTSHGDNDNNNPTSYWNDESFLCRLQVRPCDTDFSSFRLAWQGEFQMNFPEKFGVLDFESADEDDDGDNVLDASKVWVVMTDLKNNQLQLEYDGNSRYNTEQASFQSSEEGNITQIIYLQPLHSDYQFIYQQPALYHGDYNNYNDYVPGSLTCYNDPDIRIYIIIDGVLVDSCPKTIVEGCRNCLI